MSLRTNIARLRTIQQQIGVEPDGLLGPATLTAIEAALGLSAKPMPTSAPRVGLRLSKPGVDAIVRYEIGSDNYYNTRLRFPMWPGGDSGVTIGIGYDLGYQEKQEFETHWGDELSSSDLSRLSGVCGIKGRSAKNRISEFSDISISLNRARHVFINTSLAQYANKTKSVYPGIEALEPDAQSALVSLIYNRGNSMSNQNSRKEMRDIRVHVKNRDYTAIANAIRDMKRLWEGRNLSGLLKRRDAEADMVAGARRSYDPDEIIAV